MGQNKQNIKSLIENESDVHLNNLLPEEDVNIFKGMVEELRDTWTKKQVFRTETEARISVLQDMKYPNKASKYWQCVREQNVFLENLMTMSFDYRKNDVEIKKLKLKIEKEESELEKELLNIELDQKIYHKANLELIAKDRMRELKMWSRLKKEFNDGSFDTKDVNKHQLESYKKIMINKSKTVNEHTPPADAINIIGQMETVERVIKNKELDYTKVEKLENK